MSAKPDGQTFRRILGHYPTGVCAVTSVGNMGPIGMIVGSFTSVSLEPQLVAFLPDRASNTWPRIEATGRFCVNVLSERLRHVCSSLSAKTEDKFRTVAHRASPAGLPIIDGAVAWIECSVYAVHEAGDHFIAIGRVEALDVEHADQPLLFFKGGYGSFLATASETGGAG